MQRIIDGGTNGLIRFRVPIPKEYLFGQVVSLGLPRKMFIDI